MIFREIKGNQFFCINSITSRVSNIMVILASNLPSIGRNEYFLALQIPATDITGFRGHMTVKDEFYDAICK